MISVTYGNVRVEACLRNVVTLFHVLDKELEWRRERGRDLGFETLRNGRPVVAVGPEHPLEEEIGKEDGFRKFDLPLSSPTPLFVFCATASFCQSKRPLKAAA